MMPPEAMNLSLGAQGLPALGDYELRTLRIVALCSALLSLIFSTVVLMWFVQMRRNFRHQLIMLLVISDWFKAIWQFMFPVVVLARGGVTTGEGYCTATGFFIALGIESSDFAILMIAIHSALSIFRPRNGSPGMGGLYKYRKYIYPLWVIFSILVASLAFINKNNAYSAQGTYCYLPVRPFWYRLALAWIPRYLIMATITILYVWIYIYVKWTFRSYRIKFNNMDLENSDLSGTEGTRRGSGHSVLGTMLRFGSFGSHGHHHHHSQNFKEKRPVEPIDEEPTMFRMNPGFSFAEKVVDESTGPEHVVAPQDLDPESLLPSPISPISPITPTRAFLHSSRSASPHNVPNGVRSPTGGTPPQIVDYGYAADGPAEDRRNTTTTSNTDSRMLAANPTETGHDMSREVRQRHIAIQRQLRFLFIYPLVYLLIWIIPLVNNGLQYSVNYAANPSLTLQILVAISVPIQGALDCTFFTLREKPWRYIPPRTTQPWCSRLFGLEWEAQPEAVININAMTDDARRAYERREQERTEYEEARKDRVEAKKRQRLARKSSMSPMTWWDRLDDSNGRDGRERSPSLTRASTNLFRTRSGEVPDLSMEGGSPTIISRAPTAPSLRSTTPISESSGEKSGMRGVHWGGILSTSAFRPMLKRNKSSNTSHGNIDEGDEKAAGTNDDANSPVGRSPVESVPEHTSPTGRSQSLLVILPHDSQASSADTPQAPQDD